MHAVEKVLSNHTESIRMLVLETDSPHPDTEAEKGSFGDIFHQVFRDAGEAHDAPFGIETVMEYIVEDDRGRVPEPKDIADDVAAILITGSVYDAHGDEAWVLKLIKLIRRMLPPLSHPPCRPQSRRFLSCSNTPQTYGSTARKYASRASASATRSCAAPSAPPSAPPPPAPGSWELAHTPIELSPVGRALFALSPSETHIHLHQMHLDHVLAAPVPAKTSLLPRGTEVWGRSKHTAVQGVYICKRLFTSQGHLEFSEEMVRRQLELRVRAGSLSEDEVALAREKAEWLHDGEVVVQAMLRFFHGNDDGVE